MYGDIITDWSADDINMSIINFVKISGSRVNAVVIAYVCFSEGI